MNFRFSRPWRRVTTPALASLLAVLLISSCADDGRPKRYPATGKVLVDGKGVAGIQVRLYPIGRIDDLDALRPGGVTDDQGSYRLGTYEQDDGAPLGRYKAALFWPDAPPGSSRPRDLFAGAYSRPESSTFEFTIAEGANHLDDIEATRSAASPRPRSTGHRKSRSGSAPGPDGPMTR